MVETRITDRELGSEIVPFQRECARGLMSSFVSQADTICLGQRSECHCKEMPAACALFQQKRNFALPAFSFAIRRQFPKLRSAHAFQPVRHERCPRSKARGGSADCPI